MTEFCQISYGEKYTVVYQITKYHETHYKWKKDTPYIMRAFATINNTWKRLDNSVLGLLIPECLVTFFQLIVNYGENIISTWK